MNVELAQYEALAKETLQRTNAEMEPADIHAWLVRRLSALGTGNTDAALMWPDSFDYYDALLAKRETLVNLPIEQRRLLDWPWSSWNRLIDPLEPGMLVSITAPDGQGKTIVVECLAEHWASRKHNVVFVHYELNRALMMDRRMCRHTSLPVRALRSGTLTPDQWRLVKDVRPRLLSWEGGITYLHTPGWTMEQTTAELRKLHAEGLCDVAVVDYLEKVASSPRQLKMFGANVWQREADNVEQLKVFSESAEIPVVMVAQMNKAGKSIAYGQMDRSDMTGSADKSNKANLVILLKRDREEDGNYSNTVHVQVDKNTMGATGAFDQYMQPEYFRLADIYQEQV